ncbi:MFS transporter, partial [Enterobacter sichuanensis]
GGLTPIAVTMLMGVSPMAPAWYVLALSVMGLVLGMWLRQEWGSRCRECLKTEV